MFGTSTTTMAKWKDLGMPVDDTAKAIQWKIDYELNRLSEETLNLEQERALLAREQRLRTEQDRLAKAGELLKRESVEWMWSGIIAELRAKILNANLTDETKANLIDDLREIPVEKYAD